MQVVSRVTCLATGQQSGWADAAYGLHAGYGICERERTLGGEKTPLALRILKSFTNQIKANQKKTKFRVAPSAALVVFGSRNRLMGGR